MGVLFILRSRLLLYSPGTRVNREQFVLSGFSCHIVLFCPCMYGCMCFLVALVLVGVDVMLMSYAYAMT